MTENKTAHVRLVLVTLFGAACLFFATLEYMIPKPVPFFRIGFSNLPIMLALPIFSFNEMILLLVVKVLGQGLIGGTLASHVFLFSAGGSLASLIIMSILWYIARSKIGWLGLAMSGALASNLVQIVLSIYFVFGSGAQIIVPLFMGLGFIGGLITGFAALYIAKYSIWYKDLLSRNPPGIGIPATFYYSEENNNFIDFNLKKPSFRPRRKPCFLANFDLLSKNLNSRTQMLLVILVLPAFLLQDSLLIRSIQTVFWLIFALMAGKRIQFLYYVSLILAITLFSLINPAGLVLVRFGSFSITEGALFGGLFKSCGLVGMIFMSLALVRPGLRLPGVLGGIMGSLLYGWEYLLSRKREEKEETLMQLIDRSLLGLEQDLRAQNSGIETSLVQRSTGMGKAMFFVIVFVHWASLSI
jgi:uncharacterized membrane protein